MKTNLRVLATALFVLAIDSGHAGPVGPLTIFTAGTAAKASEVNGNFNAASTAVTANDARITTLETNPNIAGNLTLVPSTATAGNIFNGTTRFIHNFGNTNIFVGMNAGNLTMTGGSNTAFGNLALFSNTTGNFNTAVGHPTN